MMKFVLAAAFTIVAVNAAGHEGATAQLDDAFASICDGRVRRGSHATTTVEDVTALCTAYTTCVAGAHGDGGDRLRRAGHEAHCSEEKTACCDAAAALADHAHENDDGEGEGDGDGDGAGEAGEAGNDDGAAGGDDDDSAMTVAASAMIAVAGVAL